MVILTTIINAVVTAGLPILIGYVVSIERRLSKMNLELREKPSRQEIVDTIELRLRELRVEIGNTKANVESIDDKLDKLLEVIYSLKRL